MRAFFNTMLCEIYKQLLSAAVAAACASYVAVAAAFRLASAADVALLLRVAPPAAYAAPPAAKFPRSEHGAVPLPPPVAPPTTSLGGDGFLDSRHARGTSYGSVAPAVAAFAAAAAAVAVAALPASPWC